MPIRRELPIMFFARGCSDAIDSTLAPRGLMSQLSNLVPSKTTPGMWVPRPASTLLTNFPGFTSPGQVTAIYPLGNLVWGMITTQDNPGFDVPFCYNVDGNFFVPISNVVSSLLPSSPPTTGDWVPPSMVLVGSRILVSHPGFNGGTFPYFGWIDISNFKLATLTGNTQNGKTVIQSIAGDGTSSPIADGVQIGQTITGQGIPAGTFITAVSNGTFSLNTTANAMVGFNLLYNCASVVGLVFGQYVAASGVSVGTQVVSVGQLSLNTTGNLTGNFLLQTQCTITPGSNNLTNVVTTQGVLVGMVVSGQGIVPGSTVTAIVGGGTITINNPCTGTAVVNNVAIAVTGVASNVVLNVGVGPSRLRTSGVLTAGSAVVTGVQTTAGIAGGMTIAGVGIPIGTTVLSKTATTITMSAVATVSTDFGVTTLLTISGVIGGQLYQNIKIGMQVTGPAIPQNTTVIQVAGSNITISNFPTQSVSGAALLFNGGMTVQLSQTAIATATGTPANFAGGGTITLSQAATTSLNGVQLSIAGGTPQAPLWYAGNLNTNPLPSVPKGVTQFNGRAYFAVGNAVVVSDVGNGTQASNAGFVLTCGDSSPIVTIAGMPLETPVAGGMIQSVMAFKAGVVFQILGDPALNTWSRNALNLSVGTLSPASVVPTPLGISFIATDGLRFIGFNGLIGDVVGGNGEGISTPFIMAQNSSRIVAAYNQHTLRISVQNNNVQGSPVQDWWYDFNLKSWSGPHTFPASLAIGFYAKTSYTSGHGFIIANAANPGTLWHSDVTPTEISGYVENGSQMTFDWQTSLLPDSGRMAMSAVVRTALGLLLPSGESVTVTPTDENGVALDSVVISGAAGNPTKWGSFNWGQAPWAGAAGLFRQYRVPWSKPLVFKQAQIAVSGNSTFGVGIGNIYVGIRELGYLVGTFPS